MVPAPPLPEAPAANPAAFSPVADDVFARIAGRYDRLCDLFSLGAHRYWKARMAAMIAGSPGELVLDVASGTGDIPLRLLRHLAGAPRRIVVTDLCPQMLDLARRKIGSPAGVEFALADVHDLAAVPSASVDVLSISFALKICDRQKVFREAARVLKPGGTFVALEASHIPLRWLRRLYLAYMDWCLPVIARLVARDDPGAYAYLLRGIHGFPAQQALARELEASGFTDVTFENLTFGIVALHRGTRGVMPARQGA